MTITTSTLSSLREFFSGQQILICFNGPISRTLIGEIGIALKDHIESCQAERESESSHGPNLTAAVDVFSVYIEMSQNIRHYAKAKQYSDSEASATVVIARCGDDHYSVSAGNLVDEDDGPPLLERIQYLATLDKPSLKALYKEQLRSPRDQAAVSGAGLGLIEIARKSSQPLAAIVEPQGSGKAFFSLQAII